MDEALKQRLVGASVLVVLAVIFLPILLDGGGMEKSVQPLSISLPEAKPENTVTITLKPEAPAPKPRTQSAPPPPVKNTAPAPSSPQSAAVQTSPQSAPEKVTVSSKPKPASTPVSTATSDQLWIVQIGSFSQRNNAQALRDKLIKLGYKSFVEASGQGTGQVFRVRVGPVDSRDKAEALRSRLNKQEKRNGLVMAYP